MTSKINRMLVVLLITAIAGVAAIAKSKTEKVTFVEDVTVNGTLVKKGTYSIKYDETASEITIVKGDKTIAKAPVRVEQRDAKSKRFEFRSSRQGDTTEVTSITFEGSDQNLMITPSAAQHKTN